MRKKYKKTNISLSLQNKYIFPVSKSPRYNVKNKSKISHLGTVKASHKVGTYIFVYGQNLVTFLQLPVLTYRNIKNTVIKNIRHLQYIQSTTKLIVNNKCIQYFSPMRSQLEEVEVKGREGGGGNGELVQCSQN
jgi:hypothetical protein